MKKLILLLLFVPSVIFSQKNISDGDTVLAKEFFLNADSINELIDTSRLNQIDFYQGIVNIIREYEDLSTLRKNSYYKKFNNLFNSEAKVFDDVIPSPTYGQYLSYKKYPSNIRELKRKRLSTDIEIIEIENKSILDNKSGFVNVYAVIDKNMAFENKEGNIFYGDIVEYVDWPQKIQCIITLKYDIFVDKNGSMYQEGVKFTIYEIKNTTKVEDKNIFIPFLKSTIGKAQLFDMSNDIFLNNEKIDFQGKNLKYFIYNKIDKNEKLYIENLETDYAFTNVKPLNKSPFINQIIFREKVPVYLNYNININSDFTLSNSNQNLNIYETTFSDQQSISLTALIYKPNLLESRRFWGSKISTQLGFNVLISESKINFTNAEYTSFIQNSTDTDGHLYDRTNNIYNINEEITINSTFLNLSGRMEVDRAIKWGKDFHNIQVAGFGNLLLFPVGNSAQSNISAAANYTGLYNQFEDLIIGDDEQFDRYDLGTYNLSGTNNINIEYKSLSVIELGLLVDYFTPSGFGLNAGLSSIISNNPISNKQLDHLSDNSNKIYSLLDVMDEFKINSRTKFKIGIIYKL